MACGFFVAQQIGRAQYEGTGAHAGDILRPARLRADEIDDLRISNRIAYTMAARNADYVRLRAVCETGSGQNGKAAIGGNRRARFADDMNIRARQSREELHRPCEIELRDIVEEKEDDIHAACLTCARQKTKGRRISPTAQRSQIISIK